MGDEESGEISIALLLKGRSCFTTTVRPSKYSRRSASDWAPTSAEMKRRDADITKNFRIGVSRQQAQGDSNATAAENLNAGDYALCEKEPPSLASQEPDSGCKRSPIKTTIRAVIRRIGVVPHKGRVLAIGYVFGDSAQS